MNWTENTTDLQPELADCTIFNFIFYTLLIGTMCVLGILGNYLSIVVLQQDSTNKVAAFLLQSLAVADSLVLLISMLVLSVIFGLLPFINHSDLLDIALPYIVKYIHPLGYMAQCGTIWITVLIAINRYIAVVKPFLAHKWCQLWIARLQVAIMVCINVAVNFPRFFQFKIVAVADGTDGNATVKVARETDIGESSIFGLLYTNVFYTLFILVIPLVILVIMNTYIIRELKKRTKPKPRTSRRRSFVRRFSLAPPALPEEDNITFVMVVIIVVLIVCHTPDRIMHVVAYAFVPKEALQCGNPLYFVLNLCNLLIIVNSSTNFVVYYVVRKRFRRRLVEKVCCRKRDYYEDSELSFLPPSNNTSPAVEDE